MLFYILLSAGAVCLCFSMVVVIRLQGLSVTAGSEDIRRFFTGLKIPDGGVHIIGGELEEAFILFASDEDARRAMNRSGGCIKDSPVTLLLSSNTEMQNVLERSTKYAELEQKRRLEESARSARRPVEPEVGRRYGNRSGNTPPPLIQRPSNTDDVYVFLRGMPFSITEMEVRKFFSGLLIDEIVLLKNAHGAKNGNGYVKFASSEAVHEALKRDRQYIGSRYVEVSPATADDWCRATGKKLVTVNPERNLERDRSPLRNEWNLQHYLREQPPLAQRSIAPEDEYCVLLENLSYAAEKEDIRNLFCNAKLENDQILHLVDGDGRRTRSTFVLFKSLRDYCEALSHKERLFLNRLVYTRPISRDKMIALLESQGRNERPGNGERLQGRSSSYSSDSYDSEKVVLFVRNLPFDVRKVEIMDFFHGFDISEDKVIVLRDHEGAGMGEALIVFRSEAEAMSALSLNGRRFLGSEVMLKCISHSQMRQLDADPPVVQELQSREEQHSGRRSESYSDHREYPDLSIPRDGNTPIAQVNRGWDYEPSAVGPRAPQDRGNDIRGDYRPPTQSPASVQLINLPFQIRPQEIYDFCYGYHVIPGSVSLQYDNSGKPTGSATAVFESLREAMTAIQELNARPIGPRRIQLLLM